MRCFSKSIAIGFLSMSFSVYAGESLNKISKSEPSNSHAITPAAISSDSKMVKEFLKNYKIDQVKSNDRNSVSKKSSSVFIGNQKDRNIAIKEKNKEQTIIHLNVPETQPLVINKTEYFVFRDITLRGDYVVNQSKDIAERKKKIESLRQAVLR